MKPTDLVPDGFEEIFTDQSAKCTAISVADIRAHPERLRLYQMGKTKQAQGIRLNEDLHGKKMTDWGVINEVFMRIHRERPDMDYPALRVETVKQLRREGYRVSCKTIDRRVKCPPDVKRRHREKQ